MKVAIIDEESKTFKVIKRVETIQEAEAWIEEYTKIDPDKVYRGGFGIDAPEYMINK